MDDLGGLGQLDETGRRLLFTEARTANSFAPTPVSDDVLKAIWELARWAPTSANSQPLRVVYVRTPEGKKRLIPHILDKNQPKAQSAPVNAVLAADRQFHEFFPTLVPYRDDLKDTFEADVERRRRHGHFNAILQAAYFIMAVRACGLAAGPMGGIDEKGIDEEFFPEGRWYSLLVVNIGHPGDNPWMQRLPRLDEEEVIRWT